MDDHRTPFPPSEAQGWVLRSRALLQRSADELDGAALSRLSRARNAALELLDAQPRPANRLHWLGAAAISIGFTLVLWHAILPETESLPGPTEAPVVSAPRVAPPPESPVTAPDFELLADPKQFALIEDLEFYAWLETARGDAGG